MVKPFQFARLPKIYFKAGIIDDLAQIASGFGKNVILVTGKNSFLKTGYAEKLLQSFQEKAITIHLVTIPGEPSPEIVDETVRSLADENISLVIGIGGGSVMDAGKAISAMLYKPESITGYLEGVGNREHPGSKIPYIAVPTTSGTGSEATKNAVISRTGKDGFKRSLRHENFVPDIALIDPQLTLNCPRDVTAASGMDCFTQLTEAYLSDKSVQYTDALAMEGLKAIKDSLILSYTHGGNIEARAGMSFAALTSGICLANAGLGTVHGFASSVGGRYPVPHGVVCGSLMACVNEVNVRELRRMSAGNTALKKYSLLGKLFLSEEGRSDDFYIDGFIQYLHTLTNEFTLPGLTQYGFKEEDIEPICSITENKNNPVKLSTDDMREILLKRLF
jgi:alcohol dehydrogenase class IV